MRTKAFKLISIGASLLLGLCAPSPVAAGKKAPAVPALPKSQFLILLKPARPEAAATDDEKTRIVMHFEYLKTLLSDGKLVLAGMSTDDGAGMIIVEAADQEEAERIMTGDPAVSGNVYQGEVHPFQLVLTRQNR